MTGDNPEALPLLIRTYSTPMPSDPVASQDDSKRKGGKSGRKVPPVPPIDLYLVFDTETTSDAAMRCRFGCYRLYADGRLIEERLFYDPREAFPGDTEALLAYAAARGMAPPITLAAFRTLFRKVFDAGGQIVGFNLPFDLARIAIGSAPAKAPKWNRKMQGAHSLKLWESPYAPRLQIKHINPRLALIGLSSPNPGKSRSSRGRGDRIPADRGTFIDVRTLASAILSGGYSLEGLTEALETPTRKVGIEEHGRPLTFDYIDYARKDVAATWECFCALRERYAAFGLDTPLHSIKSEAGLGKALLSQMGITIRGEKDPQKVARNLHTYYGGRTEVRIRRLITRVILTDFMSMYPTVCTLMALWRFVIADGVFERDSSAEARELLATARPEHWQDQAAWKGLTTLVRVRCQRDMLPARTYYQGEQHASIGLNRLTCQEPQWYTLADCLVAKFLNGKAPEIVEAVSFSPGPVQKGLQPVNLLGRLSIDPYCDDAFRELIVMREAERRRKSAAPKAESDQIDAFRQFLKIVANSTSYGIFMQINVLDEDRKVRRQVHVASEEPFTALLGKSEEPGPCFHPLLGTLITGAARLMLALAQWRAGAEGLEWAFCDTDSIALAMPQGMKEADFIARADAVSAWFAPLNPYGFSKSILQLEDVNFRPDTNAHEPLYCYAIASKRYALFNLDAQGRPIIRKGSAHGLGHLVAPYGDDDGAPGFPEPLPGLKAGQGRLRRWQHDVWYAILCHELAGSPGRVQFDYHPALATPCLSKYSASSPTLLRWMDGVNKGLDYADQIKSFGPLYGLHARKRHPDFTGIEALEGIFPKDLHPVAPFHPDHAIAVSRVFDRVTGEPIPMDALRTYADALRGYPHRQESKFRNGEAYQRGVTEPRDIIVSEFHYIGKEADRWEEDFLTGSGFDPMTRFGPNPNDADKLFDAIREAARLCGQKPVADATGLARGSIRRICEGKVVRTRIALTDIEAGLRELGDLR